MNNVILQENITKIGIYIGLIIGFGIAISIIKNLLRSKKKKQKSITTESKQKQKAEGFPYKKTDYLLTLNEQGLYNKIKPLADEKGLTIFTKVRLADILEIDGTVEPKMKNAYFSKISSKHIDFVICKNLAPVLFIELDDGSHKREDRKERDKFVDNAMRAAGYSIFHCPNANELQIKLIKEEFNKL